MSASSATDEELVHAARHRDASGAAAFTALVQRHQGWLLGLLTGLLGDRSDAEDVAQEAFVRAYRNLHALGDAAAFRGWLRRIAVNQAYNARRRQRPTPIEDAGASIASSTNHAQEVDDRQALLLALKGLKYEEREVLALRYLEGLDVAEIAATLGLSLSAAKMRLSRARTAFRTQYDAQ